MITRATNCYWVTASGMSGDRLDFVFQHPALAEVHSFRSSHSRTLGSVIERPAYGLSESGEPDGSTGFLTVQHITSNGQISFDPPVFLRQDPGSHILSAGDILIARTGHTLGKAALIPEQFAGHSWGSFCIRLAVLADSGYRAGYVARFLNSRLGQRQMFMLKTGAGKFNINAEQLSDIRMPDLRADVQDEILDSIRPLEAEALRLEGEATKTCRDAHEIVVEECGVGPPKPRERDYFFQTGREGRSLDFSRTGSELQDRLHYLFYHPCLGLLDSLVQQYATVRLREVSRAPIRRGVQPEYTEDGEVLVIKTADLRDGYLDLSSVLKVSDEFYAAHPVAQVQKGDVLVASTGYVSMGKAGLYDGDAPAMADGHVAIVRLGDEYDAQFVAFFLGSSLGKVQFEKWFTGSSGQIEVQPGDLERFLVPRAGPGGLSRAEQERIARLALSRLQISLDLQRQSDAKWQEAQALFERLVAEHS